MDLSPITGLTLPMLHPHSLKTIFPHLDACFVFLPPCKLAATIWHAYNRRNLWMLEPKLKSRKKYCTFFSLNLFNIPRGIPWHHWKNLLTSKRGHSGGLNFFTKFGQIWLKTSGGSRDLNFDLICKCHTILESSWPTDLIFQEPHDLRGHWRLPEAAENEKNGPSNFQLYSLTDPKF